MYSETVLQIPVHSSRRTVVCFCSDGNQTQNTVENRPIQWATRSPHPRSCFYFCVIIRYMVINNPQKIFAQVLSNCPYPCNFTWKTGLRRYNKETLTRDDPEVRVDYPNPRLFLFWKRGWEMGREGGKEGGKEGWEKGKREGDRDTKTHGKRTR